MNNQSSPSPRGQHRDGGRPAIAMADLPPIVLDCDADTFVKNAERWAERMKEKVTSSQLRRFFGEVKRLEQLVKPQDEDKDKLAKRWEKHELEFRMLKPKAAYANKKESSSTPKELTGFIQAGVEKVRNVEDFKRFVLLFESIVGYL